MWQPVWLSCWVKFDELSKTDKLNMETEKNNILGSDESGGRNMPESVIQANILLSTH